MKKNINKKDTRKIAIYSRKSKFTGRGDTINNQVEFCKQKINLTYRDEVIDFENDVIIFEDEGFSGANIQRPAFKKMMEAVKNKEIKSVFFYRLDRISRNASNFCEMLNIFENYNVTMASATETIETVTPHGRAMVMMTSVFAQLERDVIAERVRDNMLELAKTGRWLGGTTPIGYKSQPIETQTLDGKKRKLYKLTPVATEINIVKLIYDKFLELKSQSSLETYMINNNIKTRNGIDFSRTTLRTILTNPVYAIADIDIYNYFINNDVDVFCEIEKFDGSYGVTAYNKTEQKKGKSTQIRDITEWVISRGKHKGIINGKQWIEVQNLLTANEDKRYRKPLKNNALLSGLLRCSKCGSFMRPKLRKLYTADGELRFDYMCELKEKSRKQKCDCENINGNEADKLVMAKVKELLEPNSTFKNKLTLLAKGKFDEVNKNVVELEALEMALSKNLKEIQNLLDRIPYIDIELLDDMNNRIRKLKTDNQEIEKRISELKNISPDSINTQDQAEIVLNIIETYFSTFDTLDLTTKRTLLKILISSIEFDGEELKVNLVGLRQSAVCNCVPTGEDSK